MTIDQIRYFLAIVENGGFSVAAEELYLSQSSLSKQIKSLEEELGIPLFLRLGKGVSLTEGGELFLTYAATALDEYDQLLKQMSYLRPDSQKGRLRVGVAPFLYDYGISKALVDFQKLENQIQIDLIERNQSDVLRLLNAKKIELAIVRTDRLEPATYKTIPLIEDEMVLVCRKDDKRFRRDRPIRLSEADLHDFVIIGKHSGVYGLTMEQMKRAGVTPEITLTSSRHTMLLELVNGGLGVTLLPKMLVRTDLFPEMEYLPLEGAIHTMVGLVYRKDSLISSYAKKLCEYLSNSRMPSQADIHSL